MPITDEQLKELQDAMAAVKVQLKQKGEKTVYIKLISADGLELLTSQQFSKTSPATITKELRVDGRLIGTRVYDKDKYRDGEYRELVTKKDDGGGWDDPVPSKKAKKTPATIKEVLKAYSLSDLIRMKLEDVEFKGLS